MSDPSAVDPFAASLALQYGFTSFATSANLEGITHDESLIQPSYGGNCLNWVVGHVVASRNSLLQGLGCDAILTPEESARYERGAPPVVDASDAIPFPRLVDVLKGSSETLMARIRSLSSDDLIADAPFSPTSRENETIGTFIAGFAFHEAYHVGQTGVLRRAIGKPGAIS